MYCRYTKTSIWDHKQCPLNGGEFLYRECPLLEVLLWIFYYCLCEYWIIDHSAHPLLPFFFFCFFPQFQTTLFIFLFPPPLPQYRGEVLDCLRKVVAGLGSSSSTVHRDIYKAVRNGLTDKAPHVRSSAAKVYTPSSSTPLSVSGIISNCNTQLQLIVFLIFLWFCGLLIQHLKAHTWPTLHPVLTACSLTLSH